MTDERAAAAPAGTSLGLSIVRLGRVSVLSAECVAKDKGQRSNTPLCLHIRAAFPEEPEELAVCRPSWRGSGYHPAKVNLHSEPCLGGRC